MVGVVRRGVQPSGVVKHRQDEHVQSVVGVMDSNYVGHNRVDGGGLMEGPRDCWLVVAD